MGPFERARTASGAKIAVVLSALAFFLGGALLQVAIGSRFVFFHSERYTTFGWWTFLFLLPVIGVAMFNQRSMTHLRIRYPTSWVRWLMYPIMVALVAATIVIAPLGWVAALTWAAGADTGPTSGRLVSVEEYRYSARSCDQRGRLLIHEYVASICLENIAALPAKGNTAVEILGKQSIAGVLVQRVTPR